MSDVVIVGLLSLVGTLVGTFGGIMVANKLVNYRLRQLEVKVDKHNSLIEWKYCAEGKFGVLDEQIKEANHRIDDLERGS